jgi:hypothetical protein
MPSTLVVPQSRIARNPFAFVARIALAFHGLGGGMPVESSPARAAEGAGFALGTGFTYQGRLQQDGRPAEGRFDLTFELFDDAVAGASLGRLDRLDAEVRAGTFTAELDFGHAVFAGAPAWLEISVRPAGGDAFTALLPRHRLAGEGVSLCTVNSDVVIHGSLDVDPIGAVTAVEVPCCNEATLDGGGQLRLGGSLNDLMFDSDEIQARQLLGAGPFFLNPHGGNVGIGVATTSAPLQLPAGPDAAPGSGGAFVVGPVTATNLAFDNNEIMARNNGVPSTLFLNNDGGTTVFGGPIDIGFQFVTGDALAQNFVSVFCPAGLKVLGGGCWSEDSSSTPDALLWSHPFSGADEGWTCKYDSDDVNPRKAFAVCANVR